jgi:hypothetical protein
MWFITWLAQIERDQGITPKTLPPPRAWGIRTDFSRNPEMTLPLVMVISIGTNPGRKPQRDGDGTVTAWWLASIGAVVSAASHADANDLAGYYGAVIRGVISLQDIDWANGVEWESEQFTDLPSIQDRNLAMVREVFSVAVSGTMSLFDGFDVVPADPYASPQEVDVTKVGVEFDRVALS